MISVLLYFITLGVIIEVIYYIDSRPKPPNPDIKGLSMKHWEGPDR